MVTCEDMQQSLTHLDGAVTLVLQQNREGIRVKADLAFTIQVKLFKVCSF